MSIYSSLGKGARHDNVGYNDFWMVHNYRQNKKTIAQTIF
jgi:hypothetical protein